MKFFSYLLIGLYYVLFFVLQDFIESNQISPVLIYFIYFGLLPVFLMLLDKKRAPDHIIKKSLWYGVMILISDFVVTTILIFQSGSTRNQFARYNILKVLFNEFKFMIFFILFFTIVTITITIFLYGLSRLKYFYAKHEPSIQRSAMYAAIAFILYNAYLYIYAIFIEVSDTQLNFYFTFTLSEIILIIIGFMVAVLIVHAIAHIRGNYISYKKSAQLTFVIYTMFDLFTLLLIFNPLYGRLDFLLTEAYEPILGFSIFNVFGAYLTIIVYFISRRNDDISKDVIFSYKAIILVVYIFYIIFMLMNDLYDNPFNYL